MSVAESIEHQVRAGMDVHHFDLVNESHMHNVPANSETHFRLTLVSPAFADTAPVRRHQMVYALVADELKGPVHALALHTFTPDEWRARQGQVNASPPCRGGSKTAQ